MKREAFLIFFGLFSGCSLETEGMFSGDVGSPDDFRQDDGYDVNFEVDRIAADADSDADAESESPACENDCMALPRVSAAHCEEGEGICVIDSCISGWGDCNGVPDDGCERDTTSVNNCGSCGNNCTALDHVSRVRCEVGECAIDDCDRGFQDANGIASDGCEYFCIITSGAHEVCDAVDNDCDTETDEDCGSLVLYLSFDEGVGTTVNDGSVYGNDGTLYGGATWTTDAVSGRAFSFDGVDDYIEIVNSSSLNFNDNFTVMFWVWSEPQDRLLGIISHGTTCSSPRSWEINFTRGSYQTVFLWSFNGTTASFDYFSGEMEPRVWQHVTLTFENGVGRFYVNGTLNSEISSHSGETVFTNTRNILIGRSYCPSTDPNITFLHGKLDEVAIYTRVFTDSEILDYYNRVH
jgi:hypothetical protein